MISGFIDTIKISQTILSRTIDTLSIGLHTLRRHFDFQFEISFVMSPVTQADPEKSSSLPSDPPPQSYPEGGFQAWLVVFGAFCGLLASIGLYNSTGVLSILLSSSILTTASSSSLGWIFSIYAFVVWGVGVWVGPCFDVFGPRVLLLAGAACTVVGMMGLSFCYGECLMIEGVK